MNLRTAVTLILAVAACHVAPAQEFVAPRPEEREIEPERQQIERPRMSIEGIVAQMFKNPGQAYQLVNPLAPKSMGNGQNFVSWDEKDPAKPKGFIVLGIEW